MDYGPKAYSGSVSGASLATDRLGNSNSCYYFDTNNQDQIKIDKNVLNGQVENTVCFWAKI